MSSRQLRRILQEELALPENEVFDDEPVVERGTAFSGAAFAFGGDTSSDEDDNDDTEDVQSKLEEEAEEEEEEEADNDVLNADAQGAGASKAPQEQEKKKKKKKKKKKGRKKTKDNPSDIHKSTKNSGKQRRVDDDDDAFLDEAIHQGKMEKAQLALLKSASKATGNPNGNAHFSPLFIDKRKLSAQSEIRRRFGSNFGSTNANNTQQNLRRRRNNKTGSALASRYSKANVFVDIDDHWPTPPPRTSGEGIWMDLTDATSQILDANCTYFSFKQGAQYIAKQQDYEALRATHDPNHIQTFLRENPCNIDALMQMSAVYSMTQSHDGAALLMRQALYIFECSFHPKFLSCLENGTARMDLDVGMNKSFGNCVFAYALMAGRRGSRRAAYEMLKLLLILDPLRDPSSVLLCIDFYAMSSSEYESFLDFTFISPRKFGIPSIAGNGTKNVFVPVTALPNIFFAQALSMYYLGRGKKEDSESNDVNNTKITYQRAKDTLISALLRFPGMFLRILNAVKSKLLNDDDLQYENDVLLSSGLWKEEKGHPLMDKLMDIAVKKNAQEFWKPEQVQTFLVESAEEAIVHYSNNSDLYRRQKMLRSTHYGIGLGNLSPGSRANIYRYKGVNPAIFQDDAITLPAMDGGADRGARNTGTNDSDLDLENTNTFLLFLQTLMPWNQVNPDTGRLLGGFEPPNR